MMHPKNAMQIESATGLPEHHWSEAFMSEYMLQLRMFHRLHSGGGPLPPELLIPLMRQFSMQPPKARSTTREKIQWNRIPVGTRVQATVGGHRVSGVFQQLVSAGTLAVKLDHHERVLELPPNEVRLDRSVPKDVIQSSMNDDFSEPLPKKAETLAKETPTIPVTDWKPVATGSTIEFDGRFGSYVGVTPRKKMKLTVEIDGEIMDVPRDTVKLVDTIIPDMMKEAK